MRNQTRQIVNRHDVKQYRELYAKPEVVNAVREGKPIPNGTVLALAALAEFLFGPEKITVKAGQTITWTNIDDSPHQVTVHGESTLRTPVVLKGQSTVLQFDHVGSYNYICGLHPAMKGQIEVVKQTAR